MKTVVLKNVIKNSSSNEEGMVLFNHLEEAYNKNTTIILDVDSESTLSSSFLNSSLGVFLDNYGFVNFKKTIKFKGSKTQFNKVKKYIEAYKEIYLA